MLRKLTVRTLIATALVGLFAFSWQVAAPTPAGAKASAGDHVLFLGAVERFQYREGAPLVFFASRYGVPDADRLAA